MKRHKIMKMTKTELALAPMEANQHNSPTYSAWCEREALRIGPEAYVCYGQLGVFEFCHIEKRLR